MKTSRRKIMLLAVFAPATAGFGGAYVSASVFEFYGWTLFLGLPVLVAFLSAFLLRRFRETTWLACYGVSLVSILVLGGICLLFALDGLVCLLMALPLAALLALIGSAFGFCLARKFSARSANAIPLLFLMMFPALLAFEHTHQPEPQAHEIVSRITINAPIQSVWNEVIAFERITTPPVGIFRTGIAYPLEAHIDGEGVGAIRYCTFSTGSFVEPITVCEPPHRLEFDVSASPPPMKEFSPYGDIAAPHLHVTFVSKHGRFRLWEKEGTVVLEGTTWYFQRIYPDWYWHRFSDEIIHQIHMRVLDQIKRQAELGKGFPAESAS